MPKKSNVTKNSNGQIRRTGSTDAVWGRYVNGSKRIKAPMTADRVMDSMPSFGIMGIGKSIYRFFRWLGGKGRKNNNTNTTGRNHITGEEPKDALNTAFISYDDDRSDMSGIPEKDTGDDLILDNDIDTGDKGNIIEESEDGSYDAGNEGGLEEDSYEEDPEDGEEGLEDVVVTKPGESSFLLRENFENDYLKEAKDKKPVFETHSYWKGGLAMHSYIGLRYTRRDPSSGRVYRKLMHIGFGGNGGITGQGALINESHPSRPGADASTETPIDTARFDNVVGAIERTRNNIDDFPRMNFFKRIFGSGKAAGTEFSGKYNLLTNNCNDFVIAMSRAAGAAAPARLHDTLLGPMTVYKELAAAAEKGVLDGGTRIFQGGKERDASYDNLLDHFMREVTAAAASDGITVNGNPGLTRLLTILEADARRIRAYRNELGNKRPDRSKLPEDLDQTADEISMHVRNAVELRLAKKHPALNIALLKLEALANDLRGSDPGGQGVKNRIIDQEADFILDQRTDAEQAYIDSGRTDKMKDSELYSTTGENGAKRFSFDTGYAKGVGELILVALGEADVIHKGDAAEVPGPGVKDTQKSRLREMRFVGTALGQEAKAAKARGYIERYIADRPYLSVDQTAKMLTGCILQGMGLLELSRTMAEVWSLGISGEDDIVRQEEIKDNYSGKSMTKIYQLGAVDEILKNVTDIISELKGEKPEERRDEGDVAV